MALEPSIPVGAAEQGAVGGVDIGWSPIRKSSAAAALSWDSDIVRLTVERYRAVNTERNAVLGRVFPHPLSAVAFDGPLASGAVAVDRYRLAERMLTAGFQPLIGKPGQSSSPNGQKLSLHASASALFMIGAGLVAQASHRHAIHNLAVAEAFPTSFLGVLVEVPDGLKTRKKSTSDVMFAHLAADGTLERLLARLLPGRQLGFNIGALTNHDDRAAFVCALTALCVAANDYTAVGDTDGWIILPPYELIAPWATILFDRNAVRFDYPASISHSGAKARPA